MPAFLAQMPTRSKAVLGATVLGVLFVMFMMFRMATAPSYTTLVSGVDPAQTGKITAVLDTQAIKYEIQNGGTSLGVVQADAAKARIALATAGIAATGGTQAEGYTLFDKQKLGASDFQQKMTYQRALEGEIANQLGAVQGVGGAQVRLVLPDDNLFADQSSPATAAVSLANTGDTLQPGAVRGMAQMVASSVKGLKADSVTITDSTGQLLWPNGDGSGAGAGSSGKQAAEDRYARGVEANINAMLDRTLGPGKATVNVRAQLDMDKATKDVLVYSKKGIPMTQQVETEKLKGGGSKPGGASGTAGNIPSYAAAGASGTNSNYQRTSKKTENALDKTVSRIQVAPGAVQRLDVSLMLDKSVTGAAATGATGATGVKAIQGSVAAAAGLVPARGDTITTTQLAFAKAPVVKAGGPVPPALLGPLKWVGLGVAALLFCFFMLRQLKKREGAPLAEPAWLAEIDGPLTLAALGAGPGGQNTRVMAPLPERQGDPSLQQLEQYVDREPERVVAQVRQWMQED
jgi:flagellar M-ring protein FliF